MKELTILIRTYKEPIQLLENCLNSICKQKCIEQSKIIIYNDGGDINVLNCINKFTHEHSELNISVFYRNYNIGSGNALKELYKLADTKYIIFCDGDDEYVIDNGLYTAITELKRNNWDFINCDTSPDKLHVMTIFNRELINEHLFINFPSRDDEYMVYIYTFLRGGFFSYPFYQWNSHHHNNHVHNKTMDIEEQFLWNLYSKLVKGQISTQELKQILNNIHNDKEALVQSLINLCNSKLFQ